jgi:hypothetical protein
MATSITPLDATREAAMHDDTAITLPFGKYRNVSIGEVPEGYLRWLLDGNVLKAAGLRRAVGAELARRGQDAPPPSRPPAPPSPWPSDVREAALRIVRTGAGVLAGRNEMTPALRRAHSLLMRQLAPEGEGTGGGADGPI